MVTQLAWFCPVEIKSWLDAGIFFSAVVAMRLHPSEKKDSVKGDVALHVTHCKIKKLSVLTLFLEGLRKPDADILSFTDGGWYDDSYWYLQILYIC